MAEQSKSDILMQFVLKGKPVSAECAAQKDPKDNYMDDFNPASDTADYSDFFQVLKFDFGIGVKDSDASGSKASKASIGMHAGQKEKNGEKSKGKQEFSEWLKAAKGEMEKVPYKANFEPVSFTRVIDAASPIFFESCCRLKTFDKATLVRRLSVDSMVNGKSVSTPMSFLKMTFEQVLITSVDWDDGEVLNETCKFICKKFKVEYKRQNSDGILQPSGTADWDWERDSKAAAE